MILRRTYSPTGGDLGEKATGALAELPAQSNDVNVAAQRREANLHFARD